MEVSQDQTLTESILDPVRKTRCKVLFDEKDVLRPEVKNFIMNTLADWKKSIREGDFTIKTAYIIGSSAGFQYTDSSDVDVHIQTEITDFDIWRKYQSILPKAMIYPGSKMPIEFTLETAPNGPLPFNFKDADDVYDIQTDKWLKKSSPLDVAVPYSYVLEISKFFLSAFDLQLSQLDRDVHEYDTYSAMKVDDLAGFTEKEKNDAISKTISALRIDIDALKVGVHVMKAFRHEAFDHSGEQLTISIDISSNGQYAQRSINNMVFKTFESFGYKDKEKAAVKRANDIIAAYEDGQKKAEGDIAKATEKAGNELKTSTNWKNFPEMAMKEEYSDSDIASVLLENGYEDSEHNVRTVKSGLGNVFYIVRDGADLDESAASSAERSMHRTLFKASGKWSGLGMGVLGYLLAGIPGLFIGAALNIDHNHKLDDFEQELYDEVRQDEACSKIISDIQAELGSEKPDREKLKALKKRFADEVSRVRDDLHRQNKSAKAADDHKFIESYSDDDIRKLLLENGFAGDDHNVTVVRYDKAKFQKLLEYSIHLDTRGNEYKMNGSKRDYAVQGKADSKNEPQQGDSKDGKPDKPAK